MNTSLVWRGRDMKTILLCTIIFLVISIHYYVFACSCALAPDPGEALKSSDAVFVGKVIKKEESEEYIYKVVLQVSQAFKGVSEEYVDVYTHMHSKTCGYHFEESEEYFEDEVETEEEDSPEIEDKHEESSDQDGSKSSVQAVTSALARMRGVLAKPSAVPPAGAFGADYTDYQYPPLDLLETPVGGYSAIQEKVVRHKGQVLETTLAEFNIEAQVVQAETGPVITMFELQLAPGVKVSQISNLANDLARSLGAPAVRVVAPLPGKHTIGIEVPNSEKEKVRIKELLDLGGDKPGKMHIPLFLGKDASGEAVIVDLTKLPHLLIAGTTGSGKSVCINAIIVSILLTQRPELVKAVVCTYPLLDMVRYHRFLVARFWIPEYGSAEDPEQFKY